MSRQKMGLFSTLAAVGAVGAAAGFAWRWSQRHRGAGVAAPRDVSRWEGEGGAVSARDDSASAMSSTASAMSNETQAAGSTTPAMGDAWPFPSSTRH